MAKIVAVADVHFGVKHKVPKTPDADILVVAGDLTARGTFEELQQFASWMGAQPQKHKVCIAGNHDFCFERPAQAPLARELLSSHGITYLQDEEVCIDGLRIYGTPWQPWFYDWAFNVNRGPEIAAKWAQIPSGLDLLLVHGPPYGYGDLTQYRERVGCANLTMAIDEKKPRYVVCGHIHEDAGWFHRNETNVINASVGSQVYYGGQITFVDFELASSPAV